MDSSDRNKKSAETHHANVVLGKNPRGLVFEVLEERLNFKAQGNPDFLLVENLTFGIDDARDLERWAIGKPLLGESKVSLVITGSITQEAQNALLKVLEEPPLGTYFFICLESLGGLLPTLLSRVRIWGGGEEEGAKKNDAERFLETDTSGRLALIRSLARKEDRTRLNQLLKDLEGAAYKKLKTWEMENILAAKILASARGASPKMLLEWLACVI